MKRLRATDCHLIKMYCDGGKVCEMTSATVDGHLLTRNEVRRALIAYAAKMMD